MTQLNLNFTVEMIEAPECEDYCDERCITGYLLIVPGGFLLLVGVIIAAVTLVLWKLKCFE
jgi:hypothetical protein